MIRVLYSYNKRGYEADYWAREIAAASTEEVRFIPFNHDRYLDPSRYQRAQLLDDLYFDRSPELLHLYDDMEAALAEHDVEVLLVDTCPPYHPDYLRTLDVYKALRIADGPIAAYDRDLAYLHAYDHVLYHSRAYSPELDMEEKLRYCGAKRFDFWPLALFDAQFDPGATEEVILPGERDVDVVFVGALHFSKMSLLARVKRAMGRRCQLYGLTTWKRNLYWNASYGFPGWVRPLDPHAYGALYRRAKIGFNVHNRGDYTVGSYRLFDLPGNKVMQISDGGEYLNDFFEVGREVVGYRNEDELIEKLHYYLEHDEERREIALSGYRRVMRDHRIGTRMRELGELLAAGLSSPMGQF